MRRDSYARSERWARGPTIVQHRRPAASPCETCPLSAANLPSLFLLVQQAAALCDVAEDVAAMIDRREHGQHRKLVTYQRQLETHADTLRIVMGSTGPVRAIADADGLAGKLEKGRLGREQKARRKLARAANADAWVDAYWEYYRGELDDEQPGKWHDAEPYLPPPLLRRLGVETTEGEKQR
jgi:hypothetical protein